ncbi:Pollen Ole e 1 allergen and extensin family protein [Striga hermonthica]|uniref:Pollen Ole e 1 allergen and extensin family protein n=1 Tax=Striga hermonthica TaxID=68872 RepID=A0A9N7R4B7_STRHE|nr:Pollen Ole e 1 allergen and extensin family protein [Striga hermonthica]
MAIERVLVAIFLALALAKGEQTYAGQVLKGSITCLDCPKTYDLSGIQVLIKCDRIKKLTMAYTEQDGTFETDLPSDGPKSSSPSHCMARIMGGPQLIYSSKKDSIVPISKVGPYFATSRPLSFYKKCPVRGKCSAQNNGLGSSKTVDLPLPREWGLAPSSYYLPFFPIIGIP